MEIREYLSILRKRIWIIILITVLTTTISGVYSYWALVPIYQANTSLYVGKNINSEYALGYEDILIGEQLVKDYRELAKSRLIAGIVINDLKLEGVSASTIAGMIEVNLKSDTRLIEITATHTDSKLAARIANKVADVFMRKAVELIEVDNVQVIDRAEVPKGPIGPNKQMNIAIGLMLGLMMGVGIIMLLEYLDNTIITLGDVERHLGLAVIGTISKFETEV